MQKFAQEVGDTTIEIDLLPCPFCGGTATQREWYSPDGNASYPGWRVQCTDCQANVATNRRDQGKNYALIAVVEWNQRVRP